MDNCKIRKYRLIVWPCFVLPSITYMDSLYISGGFKYLYVPKFIKLFTIQLFLFWDTQYSRLLDRMWHLWRVGLMNEICSVKQLIKSHLSIHCSYTSRLDGKKLNTLFHCGLHKRIHFVQLLAAWINLMTN